MDRASEMYGYEPLVENVFPDGDTTARFAFMRKYNQEMEAMMESLTWGSVPDVR